MESKPIEPEGLEEGKTVAPQAEPSSEKNDTAMTQCQRTASRKRFGALVAMIAVVVVVVVVVLVSRKKPDGDVPRRDSPQLGSVSEPRPTPPIPTQRPSPLPTPRPTPRPTLPVVRCSGSRFGYATSGGCELYLDCPDQCSVSTDRNQNRQCVGSYCIYVYDYDCRCFCPSNPEGFICQG